MKTVRKWTRRPPAISHREWIAEKRARSDLRIERDAYAVTLCRLYGPLTTADVGHQMGVGSVIACRILRVLEDSGWLVGDHSGGRVLWTATPGGGKYRGVPGPVAWSDAAE